MVEQIPEVEVIQPRMNKLNFTEIILVEGATQISAGRTSVKELFPAQLKGRFLCLLKKTTQK